MSIIDVFLIALGLAADAFAVSISAGSTGVLLNTRPKFRLSFHFGIFQFLMPVMGWLAGISIARYLQDFDHWIAFGLLAGVAYHMINSARKGEDIASSRDPSRGIMLVALSIATSIDALAVGFSLAMLRISIWYPAAVIGFVTGVTSFIGIVLGQKFSRIAGKRAAFFGGILIVIIGIRILLAHLFSI